MSQATIAKWNSIPLERPDPPASKRSRSEQSDDDDDDDVSLVSRSPSPPPDVGQSVDDIHEYDKYARGAPREVITVDTKIKPTNKGFAMLAKLGWVEGQPLGISGEGRVDPIPFMLKNDLTGLGKTNQDFRMIETTVSSRRNLDSERQHKETEEQRQLREDAAARKSALADQISLTLKPFYCTLCDKQFQNVAQYDEHTNSYAHHHKARAKDMQANVRIKPKEEIEKRKEKERKREEKELRKLAAAQGIKIAKPSLTRPSGNVDTPMAPIPKDQPETGRGGWAPGPTPSASTSNGRSGWSSVPTSVEQPTQPTEPTEPTGPLPPQPRESSDDMDVDGAPIQEPTFKSSWTSVNITPGVDDQFRNSVNTAHPPAGHNAQSFNSPLTAPPPPPISTEMNAPAPSGFKPLAQPQSSPSVTEVPKNQESSRSNWQKFQKAGRRR